MMQSFLLEACDLDCERDGRLLFQQLNVQLQPAQMLHVRGVNGSGKTSLLRILAGLLPPSAGEVIWYDQAGQRCPPQISGCLLWIGHAPGVKGVLTAEENLARLSGARVRTSLWQALAAVGLKGYEDLPCHSLSAGQQRRVSLARLFLPDAPLVWMLDEPFTALDQRAVSQLERRLAEHCDAGGCVILTTHHPLSRLPQAFRTLELGGEC